MRLDKLSAAIDSLERQLELRKTPLSSSECPERRITEDISPRHISGPSCFRFYTKSTRPKTRHIQKHQKSNYSQTDCSSLGLVKNESDSYNQRWHLNILKQMQFHPEMKGKLKI